MKWEKKGRLFDPEHYKNSWMVSHAALPFVDRLHDDSYRVYFASRNSDNKAQGAFIEVQVGKNEIRQVGISQNPVIEVGKLGCFDDAGAMPSSIVNFNGKKYLYYTGWTRKVETPFAFFIGVAVSEDGGKSFKRISQAPILGQGFHDPYLTASPWVLKENDVWKMWYVSGIGWEKQSDGKNPRHYYHIKYAESSDGITWSSRGVVCIDFNKEEDEYAIARPIVRKVGDLYTMWYCYRGGNNFYRAGYAESQDGISWIRKDHSVGIGTTKNSWDSGMICYPFAFDHNNTTYLLYNGNGYGKTGFGYAIKK